MGYCNFTSNFIIVGKKLVKSNYYVDKNLIFGKDTIVGIDNFQLAWEYLFTSCMKKIYGEDFVFDEDLIETQEDMYYYAVMALYSTYIAKKEEGADE